MGKIMINASIYKVIPMKLFDFTIINEQKSDETLLNYYLNQHLKLKGFIPKDLHCFEDKNEQVVLINWHKSNFKNVIFFESTPSYLYCEDVSKKNNQLNSKTKFIFLFKKNLLTGSF